MSEARGQKSEVEKGLRADCADDGVSRTGHGRTSAARTRSRRSYGTGSLFGGRILSRVRVLGCFGLLVLAGSLVAQPIQVPGSKYYVWGEVRSPGAYSFLAAPDIFELLSAGGGPTTNANLKRIVLIRAVTQKQERVNLQAMLKSGQIVRLSPGDVVIVPSSSWSYFLQGLTVLTSVATLVTLVITVMNWVGVQP